MRYELGDRSYLREKVVTTYEALWRGEDIGTSGWTELFCLKVNAEWIQTNIASMPADRLRPVARRLFAECRVRLSEEHDPATQCHALETLSGFFLGLGCRRGAGPGLGSGLAFARLAHASHAAHTPPTRRPRLPRRAAGSRHAPTDWSGPANARHSSSRRGTGSAMACGAGPCQTPPRGRAPSGPRSRPPISTMRQLPPALSRRPFGALSPGPGRPARRWPECPRQ